MAEALPNLPENLPENTAQNPLATLNDNTRQFVTESLSPATRKAYASDLSIFVQWCDEQQILALPAASATVADFLAAQAEFGIHANTLNRRLAAIKYGHEGKGYDSPTSDKLVSATLKGIRRSQKKPPEQKQAATVDKMHAMLSHCDTRSMGGKRDKALLLLGFAGAFRRSELAALQMTDLSFVEHGIRVTIPYSKTDQEGEGQQIAIISGKLDVVGVLTDWLDSAGISEGPLFRPLIKGGRLRDQALSDKSVANIVKKYATKAGLNAADFAGHSLRSGFVTSAAEAGANLFKIMDVSRHKNVATVRRYVRSAEAFKDHAGSSFL